MGKIGKKLILVTGAASSGKSEWAEILATETEKSVIYIATARMDETDPEWLAKIDKHRLRRPANWKTITAPVELVEAIKNQSALSCLLVDSLGTWVANLLDLDRDSWENKVIDLVKSLEEIEADLILVAEETGWGIVPAYRSGRLFRERLGALVRQIGAIADRVDLVVGGHVLNLSLLGKPLPKT